MSITPTYRETLINICQELYADMVWFIWVATDLAFARELKYLDSVFQEGDEIPVSMELLHSVEDPAVKIITQLIDHLDKVLQSMININAISEESVESEINQDDYTGEPDESVDPYMEELKQAGKCLDQLQIRLLTYMSELAERNPACVDLVQQFIEDENPDVFIDSPDANINLLHKLLWDGVDVTGELFVVMSDMENK